ncbi:MAG: AAA family ATPase [Bacteroidetes bacterium]|nr:MAG: AAA family ATPase [Bacteroidota bacterium]
MMLLDLIAQFEHTPQTLFNEVAKLGYIGQDRAKRAICLMAYRHMNRLRKLYVHHIPREVLPSKENYLLVGPTGSGKTFLIELLFQKILTIPAVVVDITNFSETGYVGQDVNTILTRLLHMADYDTELASVGIVCIDEFDKIASGKNSAVFSGAGTTKDVTGIGVQRELLKMLESTWVDVPREITHSSYAGVAGLHTENISFIACGAFSGFREVLKSREARIGFGKEASNSPTGIAVGLSTEEVEKAVNFEAYGIMPELMGRFARIIPFQPLDAEDLRRILDTSTLAKYKHELALDGINLIVEEAVYQLIVEKAMARETGARGLKSYVVEYLEEACFEAYSDAYRVVRLFADNGHIRWEIS